MALATVLALAGGCFGIPPQEADIPEAVGLPLEALTRADLIERSAVVHQSGSGWQVVRFNVLPEDWTELDRLDHRIQFLLRIIWEGDGYGYLFVGRHTEINGSVFGFTVFEESFNGLFEIRDDPTEMEVAFVIGARDGDLDLLLGMSEGAAAGRDAAAGLEERERVALLPDAAGRHGFAGAFYERSTQEGRNWRVIGDMGAKVSDSAAPDGIQVVRTVALDAESAIDRAGLAGVTIDAFEFMELGDYHLQWQLGSQTDEHSSQTLAVPPRGGAASYWRILNADVGPASFMYESTASALDPPGVPGELPAWKRIAWGHADVDLPALYGWDMVDRVGYHRQCC